MPTIGNSKPSMKLQERINAFTALGATIQNSISQLDSIEMRELLSAARANNGWFTEDSVLMALKQWSEALTKSNLEKWVSLYNISEENLNPKTIAIVMAGNIPLVGFHDFVSVLITGNKVLSKMSSNDKILLSYLTQKLIEINSEFKNYIRTTKEQLTNFDAVIATGSNNTARYFDYYFKKHPSIIRKNRNSVALITGNETPEQMQLLAKDVFTYFGLGCRNVSKILVPKGYDWDHFFNNMFVEKDIINNHKYANNYDYNKAVYLMSNVKLLDNEFMLLKEDAGYSSPISVVFYEFYETVEEAKQKLENEASQIQCVVSNDHLAHGETQNPQLWDYADGVDTIEFILNL